MIILIPAMTVRLVGSRRVNHVLSSSILHLPLNRVELAWHRSNLISGPKHVLARSRVKIPLRINSEHRRYLRHHCICILSSIFIPLCPRANATHTSSLHGCQKTGPSVAKEKGFHQRLETRPTTAFTSSRAVTAAARLLHREPEQLLYSKS